MRRLVFTPRARRDLIALQQYLIALSRVPAVGRDFVASLRAQCRKLAELPGHLGQARNEWLPELRSFAFRGYIIVFRYEPDIFRVVRVIEGHRDIEAQFDR